MMGSNQVYDWHCRTSFLMCSCELNHGLFKWGQGGEGQFTPGNWLCPPE